MVMLQTSGKCVSGLLQEHQHGGTGHPSAVVPRVLLLALHSKSKDDFQDRKGIYQKGTRETLTSAKPVSQPEKNKFDENQWKGS